MLDTWKASSDHTAHQKSAFCYLNSTVYTLGYKHLDWRTLHHSASLCYIVKYYAGHTMSALIRLINCIDLFLFDSCGRSVHPAADNSWNESRQEAVNKTWIWNFVQLCANDPVSNTDKNPWLLSCLLLESTALIFFSANCMSSASHTAVLYTADSVADTSVTPGITCCKWWASLSPACPRVRASVQVPRAEAVTTATTSWQLWLLTRDYGQLCLLEQSSCEVSLAVSAVL